MEHPLHTPLLEGRLQILKKEHQDACTTTQLLLDTFTEELFFRHASTYAHGSPQHDWFRMCSNIYQDWSEENKMAPARMMSCETWIPVSETYRLDHNLSTKASPLGRDIHRIMQRICKLIDSAHQRGLAHPHLEPRHIRANLKGEIIVTGIWGIADGRSPSEVQRDNFQECIQLYEHLLLYAIKSPGSWAQLQHYLQTGEISTIRQLVLWFSHVPSLGWKTPRSYSVKGMIGYLSFAVPIILCCISLGLLLFDNGSRQTTRLPRMLGVSKETAQSRLAKLHIKAGFTVRTNTAKPGLVIAQQPGAGSLVAPDTKVTLIVSGGPPQVTLPELRGKARRDAELILRSYRLDVIFRKANDYQVVPGQVIATSPPAGQKVTKGTRITVYIAQAEVITRMTPQVTTLPLETAKTLLEDRGFSLEIRYKKSKDPQGIILEQAPLAGSIRPDGSTVVLTVARGRRGDARVPDMVGIRRVEAQALLQAEGFQVITRYLPVQDSIENDLVLEQSPVARQQLKYGSTVLIRVGITSSD